MKILATTSIVALIIVGCGGGGTEQEAVSEPEVDIWKAASEGNVSVVERHLAFGTDINGTFALEGVTGTGGTPLHIAVLAHQHDVTRLLIENGADVNRKAIAPDPFGGTPLHWAVAVENFTGVEALLDAGANPNSTDNFGTTPAAVALLDLTTFTPVDYEKLSPAKKQIYNLLYEKGGR